MSEIPCSFAQAILLKFLFSKKGSSPADPIEAVVVKPRAMPRQLNNSLPLIASDLKSVTYFIMIPFFTDSPSSSLPMRILIAFARKASVSLSLLSLLACSITNESKKNSSKQPALLPIIPDQIYIYRGWGDSGSKEFLACFEDRKDLLTEDQLNQILGQSVSFGGEGEVVSYKSRSILLGSPEAIDRIPPPQQCSKSLVILSGDQSVIKNALLSNQWAYERARNEFLERRRPYLEARVAMIERIKKLDEEMLEAR